jgi:Fe2+ transport system protein B
MKKILIIIACVSFFTSCRSVKTSTEKSKETTAVEKTDKASDSTNITKISEKIDETVSVSLRTNNKVVDSILRNRLKGFQTSKRSGGNSYAAKFNYDELSLEIDAIVAESMKELIASNTSTESEKSFSEKTDEYFSKKIRSIPIWVYILLGLYFLPKILAGVHAILNPVQTLIKKWPRPGSGKDGPV